MKRILRFATLFTLVFAISACGGAGGENPDVSTSGGSSNSGGGTGAALLSWTPPTTNTDSSSLSDLAGYRIYYGTSPGNYSQVKTVGSNVTSHLVQNLSTNTWYFSVAAFDTSDNESTKSNEASKDIK